MYAAQAEEEEVGGGQRLAEEDTTLGLIMEVACVSVTMAAVEAETEAKAEADEAADGGALLVVVGLGPGNPRIRREHIPFKQNAM